MVNNPYKVLSNEELSAIVKKVLIAKAEGVRAEALLPYANEISEKFGGRVSLRECLDIAYMNLTKEVMERFVLITQ